MTMYDTGYAHNLPPTLQPNIKLLFALFMWANAVSIFLTSALALALVALTFSDPAWRPWLWAAAILSFIIGVAMLFSVVKLLNTNDRYVMALEGIVLKNRYFGPFTYGDGNYGYMSWDHARAVSDKLLALGLIKISTQPETRGQFTWTQFGRIALKQLSKDDAQISQ